VPQVDLINFADGGLMLELFLEFHEVRAQGNRILNEFNLPTVSAPTGQDGQPDTHNVWV
jgi:hypothetical protein